MLQCGRFRLSLQRPLIMGIVNVTPDSFSDGGRYADPARALAHARQLVAEGADLLDIGGESTRPGAATVSETEELERVMPLLAALRDDGVPLSVDTVKPGVMRAALAAGVDLINDVNALQAEGAVEALADSGAAVCLMHKQGDPATMQQAPRYASVVDEVEHFLLQRAVVLRAAGVASARIVLDPGIGFGKTVEHNLELLKATGRLASQGYPLLIGVSRKSLLGALTGRPVEERIHASVAMALLAVARGARIVRVHDVAATRDALKMWEALQ
ncbi:dihydropteroate synthase [Leeia sp. IMCC25680]|uniref:Dihydropteroate synthase n=2 Tax=Leeia aquatica TaxID=2725557 RepID=A0A847S900_9NEIS|nr:dihydropteroate synthase [Leeia aquatica]NLR74076.1 dihydropteroate synthase [Leeia aquatica]